MLIIALVAVLAGGGITGYALVSKHQHEQAVTAQSAEIENQSKELDELQKSSLDLIIDGYLKGDITENDLKVLDERFTNLDNQITNNKYFVELEEKLNATTEKQQKVKEQLQAVRTKFDTQTAVNALFTVPALNGKDIAKELIIADTVNSAAVAEIKEKYFVEENADEWQKTINSLIAEAETQAKEIEEIKSKLEKTLDKDKKLTKDVNAETIKTLKSDVDKLKNESHKKAYAEQLETISKLYDEKIKKLADKKAKEVGGKAKKQKDGSYTVVAEDNTEYEIYSL